MKIKVTLLLIFINLSLYAQDPSFKQLKDIAGFKSRFDQKIKELKTIKSDFLQEKHLSFMEDSIVSKGIFRYKKEDRVRLEYTIPFKYLMVLNSGKMYIKDAGKVNKFDTHSNNLFKQINDMLINTMNGNVLHSKDYQISYFENSSYYLLELKPIDKAVSEMIDKIKIFVDKKNLTVSKVRIIEKSGDYTLISFLNVQQNTEIKDEEFVVK